MPAIAGRMALGSDIGAAMLLVDRAGWVEALYLAEIIGGFVLGEEIYVVVMGWRGDCRTMRVQENVNMSEITHSERDILTIQLGDTQETASAMTLLQSVAREILQLHQAVGRILPLFLEFYGIPACPALVTVLPAPAPFPRVESAGVSRATQILLLPKCRHISSMCRHGVG